MIIIVQSIFQSSVSVAFSGVARNLIWGWGVYVLTSHCNFKTCGNIPHVNKTVTDFGGIYTDIPPVATLLVALRQSSLRVVFVAGMFKIVPP